MAALVALVNADRLQAGKSPLGFLNIALYQNGPAISNDVTSGENNCVGKTVDDFYEDIALIKYLFCSQRAEVCAALKASTPLPAGILSQASDLLTTRHSTKL